MIINIAALIFVLGITFLNSIYGLFSGIINVFCAIIAMVVSYAFFDFGVDAVTNNLSFITPNFAAPLFLILSFSITLLVLRLTADKLVRGNVRLPMWLDWVGGGVCGFIIAQIAVGTLVLGFLMLPFGERVAMFQRLEEKDMNPTLNVRDYQVGTLWTKSDAFVASFFKMLSNGSFSGETSFASVYPEFPRWVQWTGNTVQPESWVAPGRKGNGGDGFENGITVDSWWWADPGVGVEGRYRTKAPTRDIPDPRYERSAYTPPAGNRLLGVRATLNSSSAESAENIPGMHRFRPTMIRIVGQIGDGDSARRVDYPARLLRGVDDKIRDAFRIADLNNNFAVTGTGSTSVDLYFDVDERFKPSFIEYRRFARADVTAAKMKEEAPSGALPKATAGSTPAPTPQPQASGPSRFVGATINGKSGNRTILPFDMDQAALARQNEVQLSNGRFASGRVSGFKSAFEPQGTGARVADFAVPSGYGMFMVTTTPKQAKSLPGKVFNFAAATLNQYKAEDNAGNQYPLVGYAAVAKRGNGEVFEVFYTGTADPSETGWNGLLDFKNVSKNELRAEDTEITLMFLMPIESIAVAVKNNVGAGLTGFRFPIY